MKKAVPGTEDEHCTPSLGLLQEIKALSRTQNSVMVDFFAGDVKRVPGHLAEHFEKLRLEKGDDLYADLLLALTHQRFPPEEAKKTWHDILVHKYYMSEKMGRNVGVKVAVLDYLDNQSGRIKDFRLLSEKDLDCLLLFVNEDGLTGLYNHRYFQEQLREELMRCQRYNRLFSLLFVDLDQFKSFNDRYGHMKGDILLRDVAGFFKASCREADTVARYGGDEFAFILPETNPKDALAFAERLCESFRQRSFGNVGPDFPVTITISVGTATYPMDAQMPEELVEAADQALYRAKRAGRDCIRQAKHLERKNA